MSPGQIAARAGMDKSLDKEKEQIAMTEGSRLVLQAMLRDELPTAIKAGISAALTPEAAGRFADALIDAMQARATQKMDRAAGGLVRMAFKKLAFFVIAGLIVYGAGGWGALIAVGKWIAPDWMKP